MVRDHGQLRRYFPGRVISLAGKDGHTLRVITTWTQADAWAARRPIRVMQPISGVNINLRVLAAPSTGMDARVYIQQRKIYIGSGRPLLPNS
jgi:hypothetical protein